MVFLRLSYTQPSIFVLIRMGCVPYMYPTIVWCSVEAIPGWEDCSSIGKRTGGTPHYVALNDDIAHCLSVQWDYLACWCYSECQVVRKYNYPE